MKQHIKIHIALILCLLGWAQVVQAQGVDGNNIGVGSAIPVSNLPESFSFSINYNLVKYKDYQLKINIPTALVQTDLSGGSEEIQLTRVGSAVINGANSIYTFNVTMLKGTSSDAVGINIRGCKNSYNNPDCVNPIPISIGLELHFKKLDNSANAPITANFLVNVPPGPTGDRIAQVSVSNSSDAPVLTTSYPNYFDVSLSSVDIIENIKFSMYYPSAQYDFVIAKYFTGLSGSSNNGNYHQGTIVNPSIVTTDSLIFNINNAAQSYSYNFRVYFKPKANVTATITLPAVVARIKEAGSNPLVSIGDCGKKVRIAYSSGQLTLTPKQGPYTPSLQYYSIGGYAYCKNACNKQISRKLYIEANNTYLNTSATKTIVVEMRKSTIVTRVDLYEAQFGGNFNGFRILYKRCGETETTFTPTTATPDLEVKPIGSLEYIKFENVPLTANADKDFEITYIDDDLPNSCGLATNFLLYYLDYAVNQRVSIASPITITQSCPLKKYVTDTYLSDRIFNSNEEGFVRIEIGPLKEYLSSTDQKLPGLYAFNGITYSLHPNMSLVAGTPLLYYIGTSSSPTAEEFKPLGQWAAQSFVNTDFQILKKPLSKTDIFINNLKLNYTCASDMKFFVLAKVKARSKLPVSTSSYIGTLSSVPVDNSLSYSLSNWNNSTSYSYSARTALGCGTTPLGNSSVRVGETVTIFYMLQNNGGGIMNEVSYRIKKLAIGTEELTPQVTGKLYGIDQDNKVTELVANYAIDANATNPIKVVDANGATIKLLGFSKLVVAVKYTIPVGASYVGKVAKASFLQAIGKGADGTNPEVQYETFNILDLTITGNYSSCSPVSCSECVTSFSPQANHKYLLSAWVKEPLTTVTNTYTNVGIKITFNNGEIADLPVFKPLPSSPIIDGWQRIEQDFTVPGDAQNIQIVLVNESAGNNAFFDDIRIHPFTSNMKSFVYDPSTQRLVAELDENNYATHYEYDDEGILIRVKKETERGIMTIKESRNNQTKIFKQ